MLLTLPVNNRAATALSRANDPATSKSAATSLVATGKHGSDKNLVYVLLATIQLDAIVKGKAAQALTAHELAGAASRNDLFKSLDHPTIHKRLPDLRRDRLAANGVTRTCSVTGRASLTWEAVTV